MIETTVAPATWQRRLLAGGHDGEPSLAVHEAQWGALPTSAPADLLATLDASGLLGRGGAGFPTARKLRTVASAGGRTVVVANGGEGEPASAKDSLLLRRAPHLVLDGIQLAARIVGADRAHLVVHAGSGLAEHLRVAVEQRGDAVPIQVHELPTSYVASEETAVVRWLNGGDAKPMFTPPRPFEAGVGGRPTLLNNVETLAHLATIARFGVGWFRSVGDHDEPGTVLVTVTGGAPGRRVAEVPTGTPIGEILARAGVSRGGTQAVLAGGYFGTWLPVALAEQLPLAQHALHAAGGSLGAGVLIALPSDRCGIAETARVAEYLAANSAGQCGPCLNGLPAIASALQRLAVGRWDDAWWPALERWMGVVPGRGACRHPDGAVRFVASALSVFAADLAAHRAGRPCPMAVAPGFLPVPASASTDWRR